MQVGISTASLFGRKHTEEALEFLAQNNMPVAEVFLESFCEYTKEFGALLKGVKGNTEIHSVHTLVTQFEPTLYSLNERAQTDSFNFLHSTMQAAKELGAKYYTFHGPANFKKIPLKINFERTASITQRIIDEIAPYGVQLAYENVHWAYYNYVGFFKELKSRTTGLKATLDVKQARQSGISYYDLIEEMGSDLVTVHLSDVDADGKMCLPLTRGVTDFNQLFSRLRDVGFDGALLLEVYKSDFESYEQLFDSYYKIKNTAEKIFR